MIMDALKHHSLIQRENLSLAINLPLRNTTRIKFTCFDVSEKYIIFGANSGSLYLYDRRTVSFLCIIPSQLGTIHRALISRNGKQIAVGNKRGAIGVVLDLESSASKEVLLTELGDGTGSMGAHVTSFCWGEDDKELYCGDSKGTVSLLQLSMFMGRNILNITLNPVLLLENEIVQIDRFKDLLLVSTMSKCVLCNTAREEFKQIGNRPRDGTYGAAFVVTDELEATVSPSSANDDNDNDQQSTPSAYSAQSLENVRIFCARPGSRLWEANLEGNVLRTHQFRSTTDTTLIAFNRLQTVANQLILVHNSSEICIIDPLASKIALRLSEFGSINSVGIVGSEIYVFAAEQRLYKFQLDILPKDQPKLKATNVNGKKASPFRENGVYILDHLFNNNNNNNTSASKEGTIPSEITIKEALVSVVRGKYGRNIKQMFLGYDQIGPERPKTLNVRKMYNSEENYNNVVRSTPTDASCPDEEEAEPEDAGEEVEVPKKNPPKKMFSMSLLSDYQLSEEDKIVRNLYLVYRSSIISNLNFSDRYAKIFDSYDTPSIVSLLQKLEQVMDENDEAQSRLNCIRIYFDYLKAELIWEIDTDSRAYIKQRFIEYNQSMLGDELQRMEKCESCEHYLRPNQTCHYSEIGMTLIQYYWSRKEYNQCFELVQQIPYLWISITRFYIQDRREEKVVQCLWNLGDCNLLEKAANEMFSLDHWRQLLDLMLTCYNSNSLMCLNCDKLCTLADSGRNPMQQTIAQSNPAASRNDNNYTPITSNSSSNVSMINNNSIPQSSQACSKLNNSKSNFYSWEYILNVAIGAHNIDGKSLLKLLRGYDEYIPKGAIGTGFYLKCLLSAAD